MQHHGLTRSSGNTSLCRPSSTFIFAWYWLLLIKDIVSIQQLPAQTEQLKSPSIDIYSPHQSSQRIHHLVDSQVPSTWWAAALLHSLSLAESSSWNRRPRRVQSLQPWSHHWSQSWRKVGTLLLPEQTCLGSNLYPRREQPGQFWESYIWPILVHQIILFETHIMSCLYNMMCVINNISYLTHTHYTIILSLQW